MNARPSRCHARCFLRRLPQPGEAKADSWARVQPLIGPREGLLAAHHARKSFFVVLIFVEELEFLPFPPALPGIVPAIDERLQIRYPAVCQKCRSPQATLSSLTREGRINFQK